MQPILFKLQGPFHPKGFAPLVAQPAVVPANIPLLVAVTAATIVLTGKTVVVNARKNVAVVARVITYVGRAIAIKINVAKVVVAAAIAYAGKAISVIVRPPLAKQMWQKLCLGLGIIPQ